LRRRISLSLSLWGEVIIVVVGRGRLNEMGADPSRKRRP
jgi:hypothetical protein